MSKSAVIVTGAVVAVILVAGLLAVVPEASSQEGAAKAVFKGSKACKACHGDQYKAWEEMKHSKAFASLKPEQIASGKDEEGRTCVQCHVTGYGQPGGFTTAEDTPKLLNVGCESCHGPGSEHIKLMLNLMMEEKDPTPDMEKHISKNVGCTQCHNPHINYKKLYGSD